MNDNSIFIDTSQNVSIEYELAGLGSRVAADLIDLAIKFGYYIFSYVVIFAFAYMRSYPLMIVAAFLLFIPLIFYSLIFETFMQGQTIGKKVLKIKVVKLDGQQASFSSYLVRWLFIFVDFFPVFPIIGLLCVAMSKRQQRVGDMIAQTTVIKLSDGVSLRDTLYERLAVNHEISYPEVSLLSEEDIIVIKKVLNTPEYLDNYDMVYTLTNKIQSKMNVTRREPFPQEFLQAVVKDYNAQQDE